MSALLGALLRLLLLRKLLPCPMLPAAVRRFEPQPGRSCSCLSCAFAQTNKVLQKLEFPKNRIQSVGGMAFGECLKVRARAFALIAPGCLRRVLSCWRSRFRLLVCAPVACALSA